MLTVAAVFYGGPFDGETAHWSNINTLDQILNITPDHDPAVLAIYRLRSITLCAPLRVEYEYKGTVVAPTG